MIIPTLQQIKDAFQKKGYNYFTGSNPYNLNIWGIRKQYGQIDLFDDFLGISYVDEGGIEQMICHKATVDPGKYYLKDKTINPNGTFILVPGQYLGCWQSGLHNVNKPSKYSALIQKNGYKGFNGWRDNNKNGKIDRNLNSNGKYFNDVTGLNMHRSSSSFATIVGPYSAACQVRQHNKSHLSVMDIIQKSLHYFSDSFSYTLFDEEDVYGVPNLVNTKSATRGGNSETALKKWPEDYVNVER